MKYFLLILILTLETIVSSQAMQWPMEGRYPGENTLINPQSIYFNEYMEKNAYHRQFIISGNEGDTIVSPVTGTITDIAYTYQPDYVHSYGYGGRADEKSEEGLNEFIGKVGHDKEQYVSIQLCIEFEPGHKLWIGGLKRQYPLPFSTGQTIYKGDMIGTLGFAFGVHNVPHLSINYDVYGKSSPEDWGGMLMGPKYIPVDYENEVVDYYSKLHPPEVLHKQIDIIEASILECYPGLVEYLSEQEFTAICADIKKEITEPMTSNQFYVAMMPIIQAMRDNHLYLHREYAQYSANTRLVSPVRLGIIEGLCIVLEDKTEQLEAGTIIKGINGTPIEDLIPDIRAITGSSDGYSTSWEEGIMTGILPFPDLNFTDLLLIHFNITENQKLILFTDDVSSYNYTISFNKSSPNIQKNALNSAINIETLQDTLVKLKVNGFKFSDTDKNRLITLFETLESNPSIELIIDLRNCMGGESKDVSFLFTPFAESNFQLKEEWQATSNTAYKSQQYFKNYSPDFPIHENFIQKRSIYVHEEVYDLFKWENPLQNKVYIFSNNFSGSAASLLPHLFYANNRATLIGTKTPGGFYHLNAINFAYLNLQSTGMYLNIPLVKAINQKEKHPEVAHGQVPQPHVEIPITLESVLNPEKDQYLEAVYDIRDTKNLWNILYISAASVLGILLVGLIIRMVKKR